MNRSDVAKHDVVRRHVRDRYARAAQNCGCRASSAGSCCGDDQASPEELARLMGYDTESLRGIIGDTDFGLGCGNPTALGDLRPGEIVLIIQPGAGGTMVP